MSEERPHEFDCPVVQDLAKHCCQQMTAVVERTRRLAPTEYGAQIIGINALTHLALVLATEMKVNSDRRASIRTFMKELFAACQPEASYLAQAEAYVEKVRAADKGAA